MKNKNKHMRIMKYLLGCSLVTLSVFAHAITAPKKGTNVTNVAAIPCASATYTLAKSNLDNISTNVSTYTYTGTSYSSPVNIIVKKIAGTGPNLNPITGSFGLTGLWMGAGTGNATETYEISFSSGITQARLTFRAINNNKDGKEEIQDFKIYDNTGTTISTGSSYAYTDNSGRVISPGSLVPTVFNGSTNTISGNIGSCATFTNGCYGTDGGELVINSTTLVYKITFKRTTITPSCSGSNNGNGIVLETLIYTTCQLDHDGDGVPDLTDIDDDNDGIPDSIENTGSGTSGDPSADADNDGTPNFQDPQFCTLNSKGVCTALDADGDGVIDQFDLDGDNDGIPDITEAGGTDTNGDGIADSAIDTDGDGLVNPYDPTSGGTSLTAKDTDGDGVPNAQDLDSDNDGITDVAENGQNALDANNDGIIDGTDTDDDGVINVAGVDGNSSFGATVAPAADADGDTKPNYLDLDSDNDGITDVTENGQGALDTNSDGVINGTDTDGDGVINVVGVDTNTSFGATVSVPFDSDADGKPNYLDLDSDNDGVVDVKENGQSSLDLNNDGMIDGADTDNDGIINQPGVDANITFGGTGSTPKNFDGDAIPNYLDIDSDGDGITDVKENNGIDVNNDGRVDGTDSDNDGVLSSADTNPSFGAAGISPVNTDGDLNNPNYLDIDSDNDGIVDNIEGQTTIGYVAPSGADSDSDGLDNSYDPTSGFTGINPVDDGDDTDTTPDYVDIDSDGDGEIDAIEGWDTDNNGVANTLPSGTDSDLDGLDDAYDNNDLAVNPTNGQTAASFPNNDYPGTPERDWRETIPDNDNDGIPDITDIDDDNDGIPDSVENTGSGTSGDPSGDVDGDGTPNYQDPQYCTLNSKFVCTSLDADGDGVIDQFDLDGDNDGIPDITEAGGTDANGDGIADSPLDTDGDGLVDPYDPSNSGVSLTAKDTDSDGVPNAQDLDSDNDGIPDVTENGNGILDANNDGVLDGTDTDGDGVINVTGVDNNSIIGASVSPVKDADSDLVPNYLDLDSDNDGVVDVKENGQSPLDLNNDGMIDGADTDNDGIINQPGVDVNTTFGGTGATPKNFEGDAIPNYLDIDSDGDGITDVKENNGTDANNDGRVDGTDTDNDGILSSADVNPSFGGAGIPTVNTDGDLNNPNYLDIDSDNDGIVDNIEGQGTTVYTAPTNSDIDNDGLDNAYDLTIYTGINPVDDGDDTDSTPDYIDTDTDGDGQIDSVEGWDINNDGIAETSASGIDADADGLDDNYDNNDAAVNPTNGQTPTSFPNNDFPTTLERDWRETPSSRIGVSKWASAAIENTDGTYSVLYKVVVKNLGTQSLNTVGVIENLNNTFPAPTTYTVIGSPVITPAGTALALNSGFNGSSQTALTIPALSSLAINRTDTISFVVKLTPNGSYGPFNNTVITSASDGTITVQDTSSNGINPDPNGNGSANDPGENSVTPLVLPHSQIGVAKSTSVPEKQSDGTYKIVYTITVENLGIDTLKTIQVTDNLNTTFPAPSTFVVSNTPISTGSLTANGGFNGSGDINLLQSGTSKLAPGQTATITFTVYLTPVGSSTYSNTAIGTAIGTESGATTDISTTGLDADPNGNGNPSDIDENAPTVFTISDIDLFVPDGFTPNGDGNNDLFIVSGIQNYPNTKLSVFNRWGNIVYSKDNYDNTWDGNLNVSGVNMGSGKVQVGTYYYILEFENGKKDAMKGFVVIKY